MDAGRMVEGISGWGGTMASAEHEPTTGVWSGGQGGEAPPEAEAFWSLDV